MMTIRRNEFPTIYIYIYIYIYMYIYSIEIYNIFFFKK
jgi:hypothetical protein